MPVVTGTGLQNVSDVIDNVRSALSAQGWTTARNTGTVGSNDKEIWMHLPAAQTFNGINITIGMKSTGNTSPAEEPGRLKMVMTYLTPAEALITASPEQSFDRALGAHNRNYTLTTAMTARPTGNNGDTYPDGLTLTSSVTARKVACTAFDQGANYLNHWIITPNNSPLGASEQYVYVIVEVASGVYTSFAFGEGIKLGGSGWEGGLFIDAQHHLPTEADSQKRRLLAGDSLYNSTNADDDNGFILNFNNFNNDWFSPRQWNPWCFMGDSAVGSDNIDVIGMGPKALGRDMLNRSPSAFSGQAIRLPARFYCQNNPDVVTESVVGSPSNRRNNWRPLLEAPDFFHTNIEAFENAEVVQDDAETFIVFPYYRRTGADNSGNFGFMIRHPDL